MALFRSLVYCVGECNRRSPLARRTTVILIGIPPPDLDRLGLEIQTPSATCCRGGAYVRRCFGQRTSRVTATSGYLPPRLFVSDCAISKCFCSVATLSDA